MWQSILFSNNGNILASPFPWRSAMLVQARHCIHCGRQVFAAWTQSGESGNTLKIKCSVTADERANIFPCLQRPKPSAVAKVRWAIQCFTLTKQASAKTTEWSGSPRFWLTPSQKKKPRRYLRGCALGIVSPSGLRPEAQRQCRQSPTAVPECPKMLFFSLIWILFNS